MHPKQVPDTWESGDPYERYVGRWSRKVAPLFLDWLDVPAGRRWLDIGCGTGALCAAIVEACAPSSLDGVDPSQGFLASARRQIGSRATFHCGSATALPLDDGSVDVAVSGLVLNFVTDQAAALAEMKRVTRQEEIIGAYVWNYAGKMELMQFFWDAAVSQEAGALKLDEGKRFPCAGPKP